MNEQWDFVFQEYVKLLISPDGRETFESTEKLVEKIISNIDSNHNSVGIDIGSGWGNLTISLARKINRIIGVEPNRKNINEAIHRVSKEGISNIVFKRGTFEHFSLPDKADIITSSLAFHQVKYRKRGIAIKNIFNHLNKDGVFVLCDTIMLFDAENDSEQFDKVYRYLLPKTTPSKIYQKYIEPKIEKQPYIYTWKDMKKYTPKNEWYYSINDLKKIVEENDMEIENIEEIVPFFGIVKIVKK